MSVIGIDLGTTNSVTAAWTVDGPQLIPNALGRHLTPSIVGLDEDNAILVGEAARDRLVAFPERTISSFKRWMGSSRQVRLGRGSLFRPEELSALVLRSLKADAEAQLGEPISEAIISVPAYFNDIQRKATLDAARLAGLKVERLVNEPTAAALAYGLHSRREGLFLVFDLGGGTFDVSLLESFEGVMEVRATAGNTFLGGDDFTRALMDVIADRHRLGSATLPRSDAARLLRTAEQLKQALSSAQRAEYQLRVRGQLLEGEITRERFEDVSRPLFLRLRAPLERAIGDSGMKLREIDAIVLVGGATRMPMIRTMLARLFGQLPLVQIDPDTTVALGAAVQAGLKVRDQALEDIVMTDVCPFTLGTSVIETPRTRDAAQVMLPIIERNSAVPISRSQLLTTVDDDQTAITLRVYQGESRQPDHNVLIGELQIPIPAGPAGKEKIEVRFTYDINGALEVEVVALSTGARERRVFRNAANLSEAELDQRFAALSQIKVPPREQAPSRALLARAEALYEELLGEQREIVAMLMSRFAREINDPAIRDHDRIRTEFSAELDRIERTTFRLV